MTLSKNLLKNASNFVAANPDAEKARLHNQIRTEAGKIKKNLVRILLFEEFQGVMITGSSSYMFIVIR